MSMRIATIRFGMEALWLQARSSSQQLIPTSFSQRSGDGSWMHFD